MDKYFTSDLYYETESPYLNRFSTSKSKKRKSKECRYKSAKSTYQRVTDPIQLLRQEYERSRSKVTDQIMNEMRKQYLAVKLRKIMAVELLKNRVRGDLRRVVKQIDEHVNQSAKSRDFIVVGGGPTSLSYFTRKRATQNKGCKITIEVDVRGYIPDNVMVDTENNRMSIRAMKVNGIEKVLGIVAPSTSALSKIKVNPPKGGMLILQYCTNDHKVVKVG